MLMRRVCWKTIFKNNTYFLSHLMPPGFGDIKQYLSPIILCVCTTLSAGYRLMGLWRRVSLPIPEVNKRICIVDDKGVRSVVRDGEFRLDEGGHIVLVFRLVLVFRPSSCSINLPFPTVTLGCNNVLRASHQLLLPCGYIMIVDCGWYCFVDGRLMRGMCFIIHLGSTFLNMKLRLLRFPGVDACQFLDRRRCFCNIADAAGVYGDVRR